jgi:uncharacterized protein (TIGR02118 family)
MPPHIVYVGYPNTAAFDVDYYGTTHFAMVEKAWKDKGLVAWSVTSFAGNAEAPFIAMSTLVWKDADSARTAMTPEHGFTEIVADVPNFTSIKPVFFAGTETAANVLVNSK